MKCINKVTLLGFMTDDAKTYRFQSGDKKVQLRVHTKEAWKDKQTGEWKYKNEYHSVDVSWADELTAFAQNLVKGDRVYVEGILRTAKFQDKENQTRYRTYIDVNRFGVVRMATAEEAAPSQRWLDEQAAKGGDAPQPSSDLDDEIPF